MASIGKKMLLISSIAVLAISLYTTVEQAMADRYKRGQDRPPVWNELGKTERGFLKHHSESWHTYPPSVRNRLRRQARRLMEMDPERLEQLRHRAQEFQRLPPHRQQALCESFEQEHGYRPLHCDSHD